MSEKDQIDNNSIKKAAHDINNILTSILNSAENLVFISSLTDEQTTLVNNIKRNAALASQLISEKLLNKKRAQVYKESIILNKIVNDISDTLKQILKENVLFIPKSTDDRITVYANYNDLYRVLLNLFTNANDAINDNGSIEIDYNLIFKDELQTLVESELPFESYSKIVVSDNGKGIEKDNLEKIFEEGFSTKNKNVESGFGLNIVREIVNDHDGYIFVSSEVGKGTSFELYLPSFINEINPDRNCTILIADDEEPVRESLAELLQSYNYEILQAENGDEVLDLFKNDNKIDLLIIDKNMPVVDGLDCIKELTEKKIEAKIILVTGNVLEEEEKTEVQNMIDKIIIKPYNFFDLLNDIFKLTKN